MKKIYEFLIGDTDDTGVKTISLVDNPAMESDFISFNKDEKKPQYIALEKEGDEYKQVVAGLSMIPDKLIYRIDPATNEDYYGYFSQETIEQIRTKYHKEVQTSNVNLDHDENKYVDAFLIESYILSSQERVDEVLSQGIEGATLGAWYTQFKIEDEEVFKKVLDGEFNGFSIEAYLNREYKTVDANLKNNFKEKEKEMKKSLIDKFKDFLETLENEESEVVNVTLEEALVPEEAFTIVWAEVGEVVQKRYENEEGEEVTEDVGQGEFALEDGRVVVVDENSALIEVKDAPAVEEEEEVVKDEEEELNTEETTEEEVVAEVKAEGEEEVVAEDEAGLPDGVKTWLTSIAGEFDDGEIYVSFQKQGGELTYGSVSTWANIKMSQEKSDLVVELEAKVAELEEKLSEPIAEPQLTDNVVEAGEAKELTVYETIMKRKGLN